MTTMVGLHSKRLAILLICLFGFYMTNRPTEIAICKQ